jgi:hypothetical protein
MRRNLPMILIRVKFNLARIVVELLSDASHQGSDRKARVSRLQSKHQFRMVRG